MGRAFKRMNASRFASGLKKAKIGLLVVSAQGEVRSRCLTNPDGRREIPRPIVCFLSRAHDLCMVQRCMKAMILAHGAHYTGRPSE